MTPILVTDTVRVPAAALGLRASRAAAGGRVFRRRRGSTSAAATSARTLSRASSTLRAWSRVAWLVTRSRPSASSRWAASARRRARAASASPSIASRSTVSSTRVATLLTRWPLQASGQRVTSPTATAQGWASACARARTGNRRASSVRRAWPCGRIIQ